MYKLFVNTENKKGTISKEIYGHFSEHLGRCIYEGLYVGEDSPIPNTAGIRKDVVEALKEIKIPVLRWPGGCFADEYHWKDGIGPKGQRKKIINTHWGGVVEDNSFGTKEFMELCRQLGCKAYVNGNLGSGTVQEMSEWVEYMTFNGISPMADLRKENGNEEAWDLHYFGVGNENWGCGGNMTPEFYGNEYRRYQTYVRSYKKEQPIYKIACGPNVDDYAWTEAVLKTCCHHAPENMHGFMDGLSLHYYTFPGDSWEEDKGSATDFDEKIWYKTLKKTLYMDTLIKGHCAIMDKYDPEKKIGLIIDEWGTWYNVEPGTNPGFLYQQNTMRDALVASLNLNIFNKHCNRVKMANIAQLVNVLQSVILTEGEKMLKTPTYYVFHMYKCHQGAQLLDSYVQSQEIGLAEDTMVPNLHESSSIDANGNIHITIANLSVSEDYPVEIDLYQAVVKDISAEILHNNMRAKNTFDMPDTVQIENFHGITVKDTSLNFTIPKCSVIHITVAQE